MESSSPRRNPFEVLRDKLGDSLPRSLEPAPRRPPRLVGERVTVRRERSGRGGKTVTIAEGPGLEGRELASLAREAARALGVGANVERGALVVQGDQRERLSAWLAKSGFEHVVLGN